MRHPSKVGAFCERKLANGASINVLGRGGPKRRRPIKQPVVPDLSKGPSVVSFARRLKMRAARDARRNARRIAQRSAA